MLDLSPDPAVSRPGIHICLCQVQATIPPTCNKSGKLKQVQGPNILSTFWPWDEKEHLWTDVWWTWQHWLTGEIFLCGPHAWDSPTSKTFQHRLSQSKLQVCGFLLAFPTQGEMVIKILTSEDQNKWGNHDEWCQAHSLYTFKPCFAAIINR